MMQRLILRESLDDAPPIVTGRRITTRIATYNRVYRIGGGRQERIRRGAFKDALSRPRAALRWRHHGERPGDDDPLENYYGELVALREDGDALVGDFDVFPGEREDKLLRLVTSGTVRGVSLAAVIRESQPVRTPTGMVEEIARFGRLDGVSITPEPAYDDAEVLAVRDARRARVDNERQFWANLRTVR